MTKTTTARRASRKPTLSPEERDARLSDAKEMLASEVAKIRTSAEWIAWLRTMRKFHHYSFNNMLLIMVQAEARGFVATRCAGFGTWKELGRCVKKGEHGLKIFRPNIVKIREGEPGYVPGENRTKCVGFALTTTFDVSQTDGEPLPEPPAYTQPKGIAPAGMWDALTRYAESLGFSVRVGNSGPADGHTDKRKAEIVISERLTNDAHRCAVLVHEIGHASLHMADDYDYRGHRGEAETEAESIAFVIADYFGLNTGTEPFHYIAGWLPDVETLSKVGQRVISTAHKIIVAVEPDIVPGVMAQPETEQPALF